MTTYVKRLHRFFNVDTAGEVLISRGLLTKPQFDQVIKDTVKARRMYLVGFDWLLMDQLLGQYRQVPFDAHCEALSAGLDRPFEGPEDLYQVLADLELIPVSVLNRTVFRRIPDKTKPFAELAASMGVISKADLQTAMGIQRMLAASQITTGIGSVIRAMGRLSIVDFFQILSVQTGVPYQSLDGSAAAIWDAAGRRPS